MTVVLIETAVVLVELVELVEAAVLLVLLLAVVIVLVGDLFALVCSLFDLFGRFFCRCGFCILHRRFCLNFFGSRSFGCRDVCCRFVCGLFIDGRCFGYVVCSSFFKRFLFFSVDNFFFCGGLFFYLGVFHFGLYFYGIFFSFLGTSAALGGRFLIFGV